MLNSDRGIVSRLCRCTSLCVVFAFVGCAREPLVLDSPACIALSDAVSVCASSDMARAQAVGNIELDEPRFALQQSAELQLPAARNETIAFQLVLQRRAESDASVARINIEPFAAPLSTEIFQAWYHPIKNGAYTFGADSAVLPTPGEYPDALVPQHAGCRPETRRVFSQIRIPEKVGGNQSVWVDVYVPAGTSEGLHSTRISLSLNNGKQTTIPLNVLVMSATLPDQPTIDAVGEIYRAYALEGAGKQRDSAEWIGMAHCYQQLAHQHRMVFIERWDEPLDEQGWQNYLRYVGPMLDGSLFSEAAGYTGTGMNKGVHVWRTPWSQQINAEYKGSFDAEALQQLELQARAWQMQRNRKAWENLNVFAYLFDEVDGPTDENPKSNQRLSYLKSAHQAMADAQAAIDRGAGPGNIDLIWTSHSNPAQWQGIDGVDLTNIIRWWSPNAGAADPNFLAARQQEGHRIWFYHHGHPAVGTHNINAHGIEMRSWGVISERYGFDGQFMWAVNLGQDEQPFRTPTYRAEDDRVGTGVIVYPGNQLNKIGYDAVPGPIPSMRMKAWRRGLQDAELARLARANGHGREVDRLLQGLVPVALADAGRRGHTSAQWSQSPADWIRVRDALLALASEK